MNESQRKQDNSIQGSKQPAPTYSLACRFQKAPAATKTSMARHHITPREKKRPSLPRTKRSTGAKERSVRVILNNKKKSKKIVKSSCSMFSPRARAINHSNARATNPTGLNKHETRPPHQPPPRHCHTKQNSSHNAQKKISHASRRNMPHVALCALHLGTRVTG